MKYFSVRVNFSFFHTVVRIILLHKFRQLFPKSFRHFSAYCMISQSHVEALTEFSFVSHVFCKRIVIITENDAALHQKVVHLLILIVKCIKMIFCLITKSNGSSFTQCGNLRILRENDFGTFRVLKIANCYFLDTLIFEMGKFEPQHSV